MISVSHIPLNSHYLSTRQCCEVRDSDIMKNDLTFTLSLDALTERVRKEDISDSHDLLWYPTGVRVWRIERAGGVTGSSQGRPFAFFARSHEQTLLIAKRSVQILPAFLLSSNDLDSIRSGERRGEISFVNRLTGLLLSQMRKG